MTEADIHHTLVTARDIFKRKGMAKGTLQAADGRVCLRGALLIARYGTVELPWHTETAGGLQSVKPEWAIAGTESNRFLRACEEAMGFTSVSGFDDLTLAAEWNNQVGTTSAMVLARFEKAIAATGDPVAPEPQPELPKPVWSRLRPLSAVIDPQAAASYVPDTIPVEWSQERVPG